MPATVSPCPNCNGQGIIRQGPPNPAFQTCPTCHGSGLHVDRPAILHADGLAEASRKFSETHSAPKKP